MSTNNMRIFGAMELAFSHPQEFSLAPQVFMRGEGDEGEGGGSSTDEWLGNIPANLLFGAINADEYTATTASSSSNSKTTNRGVVGHHQHHQQAPPNSATTVGLLKALDTSRAQWPVLNLPLSSRKTLRVEVAAAATSNGSSAVGVEGGGAEDNYRPSSLLFQQIVAAENARRRGGAAANATVGSSSIPPPTAADSALLALLRAGIDPNEGIATDVTPAQLLFALGELQRRFDGGAATTTAGNKGTNKASSSAQHSDATTAVDIDTTAAASDSTGAGLSEPMKVATVSESFVRLLAWQRLGQIMSEADAVKQLGGSGTANVSSSGLLPPNRKKLRTEEDETSAAADSNKKPTAHTDLYTSSSTTNDGTIASASNVSTGTDSRIDLFKALAAIMAKGPNSTSTASSSTALCGTGTSTSSTSSSVITTLTSRSTQCHMSTASRGINGTLPFADVSKMTDDDVNAALVGCGGSAYNSSSLTTSKAVNMAHCGVVTSTTTTSATNSDDFVNSNNQRQLSPIVIQIWDLRKGLLGAEVVGEGGADPNSSSSNNTVKTEGRGDEAMNTSRSSRPPRVLKVRLPYGVTTVGSEVSEEVQIGLRGLNDRTASAAAADDGVAPHHFRVIVMPSAPTTTAPPQAATTTTAADGANGAALSPSTTNGVVLTTTAPSSSTTTQPSQSLFVRVVACGGGGSGIRVDGLKWSYGAVMPVAAGQTVRFGKHYAMAYTNTAVVAAAAAAAASAKQQL